MRHRYSAVYAQARWTILTGWIVIIAGAIVSILTVIGACFYASYSDSQKVQAFVCGIGICIGLAGLVQALIAGFLLIVAGQLMRAFADIAVNTSPLLTNPEKASIMGL
jgi:hypothetical protein